MASTNYNVEFKGTATSLNKAVTDARNGLKRLDTQAKASGNRLSRLFESFTSAGGGIRGIAAAAGPAGAAITAASAATVAWAAALNTVADRFDELSKSARGAGVSVEFLSEVRFAAQLAGTDVNGMNKALVTLSDRLVQAREGSKLFANAFKDLNLDPTQFKSVEELLPALADRFAKLPPGIERTALAVRLFGARLGRQMIPLLIDGSQNLEKMREAFRRLGGTVTTENARAAEKFNDALSILNTQFQIIIQNALQPMIVYLGDLLFEFNRARIETGSFAEGIKAAFAVFLDQQLIDGLQFLINTLRELQLILSAFTLGEDNFGTKELGKDIEFLEGKIAAIQRRVDERSRAGRPSDDLEQEDGRVLSEGEVQLALQTIRRQAQAEQRTADARFRSETLARRTQFEQELLELEKRRLFDARVTNEEYYSELERLQDEFFANERGKYNEQAAAISAQIDALSAKRDEASRLELETQKQRLIQLNDQRDQLNNRDGAATFAAASARFAAEEEAQQRILKLSRDIAAAQVDPRILEFGAQLTALREQQRNASAQEVELLRVREQLLQSEFEAYQRSTQQRAAVVQAQTEIVRLESQYERGLLTTLQAEEKINKALAERYNRQLGLLEQQRAAATNPAEVADFDLQIAELQAAQLALTNAEQDFKNEFTSNVQGFFSSIVQGTQSGTEAAKSILQNFLQFFADRIGRDISEQLYTSIVEPMRRGSAEAKSEAQTLAGALVEIFTSAGDSIAGLFGGAVTAGASQNGAAIAASAIAAGAADGGMATRKGIQKRIPRYADGGPVRGPGTKTSDSILARLSNREFVHPAKAVDHYGEGVMESIRRLAIPRDVLRKLAGLHGTGAMQSVQTEASSYKVPGFATGGLVDGSANLNGFGQNLNSIVLENRGTPQRVAGMQESFDEFRGKVTRVLLEDLKNNAGYTRNMAQAFQLGRG